MLTYKINKTLCLMCVLAAIKASALWGSSHHPQQFLKRISGSPNEGEQIVQHYCANCHAMKPIISIGAPRIKQRADWMPRLKKGLSGLLKQTEEGLNAMPARGGCFECTDKQLLLAILSMLPEDEKKKQNQQIKDHK